MASLTLGDSSGFGKSKKKLATLEDNTLARLLAIERHSNTLMTLFFYHYHVISFRS